LILVVIYAATRFKVCGAICGGGFICEVSTSFTLNTDYSTIGHCLYLHVVAHPAAGAMTVVDELIVYDFK